MPKSDLIAVELTQEQAALFVLFQGQYDNIGFLFKENVFDLSNGSATLNFDKSGRIRTIKKEIFSYASNETGDKSYGSVI